MQIFFIIMCWQDWAFIAFQWFDGKILHKLATQVLYSSEQLDLLAIIMTAVKILFLGGALAAASQIVRVVEPSIQKSEKLLHTTLIRNEVS